MTSPIESTIAPDRLAAFRRRFALLAELASAADGVTVLSGRRDDSGWLPCRHRSTRECCAGGLRSYCDLDHGDAPGLVERHDCEEGCRDRESP